MSAPQSAPQPAPRILKLVEKRAAPSHPNPCECCPVRPTKAPYLPPVTPDVGRLTKIEPSATMSIPTGEMTAPSVNLMPVTHSRGPPVTFATHNEPQARLVVWLK